MFLPNFQATIARLESRNHRLEMTKKDDQDAGLARSPGGRGNRGGRSWTKGTSLLRVLDLKLDFGLGTEKRTNEAKCQG